MSSTQHARVAAHTQASRTRRRAHALTLGRAWWPCFPRAPAWRRWGAGRPRLLWAPARCACPRPLLLLALLPASCLCRTSAGPSWLSSPVLAGQRQARHHHPPPLPLLPLLQVLLAVARTAGSPAGAARARTGPWARCTSRGCSCSAGPRARAGRGRGARAGRGQASPAALRGARPPAAACARPGAGCRASAPGSRAAWRAPSAPGTGAGTRAARAPPPGYPRTGRPGYWAAWQAQG